MSSYFSRGIKQEVPPPPPPLSKAPPLTILSLLLQYMETKKGSPFSLATCLQFPARIKIELCAPLLLRYTTLCRAHSSLALLTSFFPKPSLSRRHFAFPGEQKLSLKHTNSCAQLGGGGKKSAPGECTTCKFPPLPNCRGKQKHKKGGGGDFHARLAKRWARNV